MSYRCPLCHQPLYLSAKQYVCSRQHTFDIAKEGYVNLLPVQAKRSKDPGDNADMVKARHDFLNRGFYTPLRDQIDALWSLTQDDALLDLGCGEGWYSGPQASHTHVYGVDISKSAIRLAAKHYPQAHFAVANNISLPFVDACFSHALNVFAPLDLPELLRVLIPGGSFIQVIPAEYHLFELKQILYHQARLHSVADSVLTGFELIDCIRLQHSFELKELQDLKHLIQMTPYVWQAEKRGDQVLIENVPLHCQMDVRINVYQSI